MWKKRSKEAQPVWSQLGIASSWCSVWWPCGELCAWSLFRGERGKPLQLISINLNESIDESIKPTQQLGTCVLNDWNSCDGFGDNCFDVRLMPEMCLPESAFVKFQAISGPWTFLRHGAWQWTHGGTLGTLGTGRRGTASWLWRKSQPVSPLRCLSSDLNRLRDAWHNTVSKEKKFCFKIVVSQFCLNYV